jgi:hypothetical protein
MLHSFCNLLGCSLVWIRVNRTRPPPPPDPREAAQAKDRADLIKRLFAVAISVGAATTLYQMPWVRDGRTPCIAEYQQLLILIAAMAATVLSWDGYLRSIAQRPLRNFWRFAIDILLVFIYLFLLMTSKLLTWWLFIHALIYALYALWDFLTITDWIVEYYPSDRAAETLTIGGVYAEGVKDGPQEGRGPIITISWGLYFWLCERSVGQRTGRGFLLESRHRNTGRGNAPCGQNCHAFLPGRPTRFHPARCASSRN